MAIAADAINDTPVLVTPRLELSFGTAADADVIFPYVHGEAGRAVTDTLIWDGPEAPTELTAFFELHRTGTFAANGFHWLVRDRDGSLTGTTGHAIGAIGMRSTDDPDMCDIGYWLIPPLWGRGLMAEAIAVVVERAFGHWGFEAVGADVFSTNERSAALLLKLGFVRDGLMPDYNIKRGCPVDGVHYVLRRHPGNFS